MGKGALIRSFIRHVAIVLDKIDYPDISKQGSRAANAYRLARKELRYINEKGNILPEDATPLLSQQNQTALPPYTDNGQRREHRHDRQGG